MAEIQQLRTLLNTPSTGNAFFLQQHKMALRLNVLDLTTVVSMVGPMTTMGQSAAGWREIEGSLTQCGLRQRMWAQGAISK